jgi:hypothetical protein
MGSIHVYWILPPEHASTDLLDEKRCRTCVCRGGRHVGWLGVVRFSVTLDPSEVESLGAANQFYLWQTVARTTIWEYVDRTSGTIRRGTDMWGAEEWFAVDVGTRRARTFDLHCAWKPREGACAIYSRTECLLSAFRHVEELGSESGQPMWKPVAARHGAPVIASYSQTVQDGVARTTGTQARPRGAIAGIPPKPWGFDASVLHCASNWVSDPGPPHEGPGPGTPGGDVVGGPTTPGPVPWEPLGGPGWPTTGGIPGRLRQDEGVGPALPWLPSR